MIEHLSSHLATRKIEDRVEGWIKAGQRTDPIRSADGTACWLVFGFRYRLRSLLCCLGFGAAFDAYCWLQITDPQLDVVLAVGYFGFILPVFVLSTLLACAAYATRVKLDREALDFRRFGGRSRRIEWKDVVQVYCRPVSPTIVLVVRDGRRVCLSTQLDGITALIEHLRYAPAGVVERSVVDWML